MNSHRLVQTLPFEESVELELPALAVQANISSATDHSSELYRLYLNHSEEAKILLEGQSLTLRRGELLTLSPGEIILFNANAEVQSLSFHHNFFCVRVMRNEVFCDGVVFNRLTGLPIVEFPASEFSQLENRFHELEKIIEMKGPLSRERALNVIRTFLLHAADFKLQGSKNSEHVSQERMQLSPLVLAFQNLVENTFAKHEDASYYSRELKVSTVTLNRKVKEELGQTIMQIVNERLAIEARIALRSGNRSVKEVAFDLGFKDPLYFSRFFRKHFGNPPSQYFQLEQANT